MCECMVAGDNIWWEEQCISCYDVRTICESWLYCDCPYWVLDWCGSDCVS